MLNENSSRITNKSDSMQNDLLKLKNLGKTSVRWLHAVGVQTEDQLHTRGAVDIYRKVKARGFKANRVLLYALHGAILDKHWSDLEPETKAELLAKAEDTNP